jgi:hypothetical protein
VTDDPRLCIVCHHRELRDDEPQMGGASVKLTMRHFLHVVWAYRTDAREQLLAEGFHPKVIEAKAEKAARKGYTEYGVVVDRPWLTATGAEYLNGGGR